ncbi:MAG: hypothetical protein CR982_01675 [Candidatus Cloacimonadota bacterium]|nr:MAG: hypothetical protein CR982_01675 [Candidatus Cloacimonadota bacterium]PIE79023.1 MAG: hypothetical protein CSA15_04835 [Candidatus Delongbacteria bacterium]
MVKELFYNNKTDSTINIVNSKIDGMRSRDISQTGFRVFTSDGRMGMSAAEGEYNDKDLWQKAEDSIDLGLTYNYDLERDKKLSERRGDTDLLNLDYLRGFTENLLRELEKLSNQFIVSEKVTASLSEIGLNNTLGLDLNQKKINLESWLLIKRKGSRDIIDAFLSFESYTKPNLDKIVEDAENIFKISTLDEISIDQKEIPVVFMYGEILQKFYEDISGKLYQNGISLLAGKKGKQIFSDKINLIQTGILDKHFIFNPFDHEGYIHNQDRYLVRNGILETIFYDKETAAKYNEKTTGNGFRSFDSNPVINSLSPIFESTTNRSLKELSSDQPILIPFISGGGDFLPNGDYSSPVQVGFLMKNGKIIGKTKQCTIKGNYIKSLNENLLGVVRNDLLNMFNGRNSVVSRMEVFE